MIHFKGGPWSKETWSKHWGKKLTIIYWRWIARWHKGMVVFLLDYQNEIYISVAFPTNDPSVLRSWVYFSNKIGAIDLHSDGTVTKDYQNYYIYNWLPFDVEERISMVLAHDAKNFELFVLNRADQF